MFAFILAVVAVHIRCVLSQTTADIGSPLSFSNSPSSSSIVL